MQNHLTRLKQLTLTDSSSRQKTMMLEMALSQCESEKKELEDRILSMENQELYEPIATINGPPSNSNTTDLQSIVETLKIRFDQLMDEHKSLKEAHATLRLVKRNETDKLYDATSLLNVRDMELELLKRRFAQAQFEVDEFKLIQRQSKLRESIGTPALDPKSAEICKTKSDVVLKSHVIPTKSEAKSVEVKIVNINFTPPASSHNANLKEFSSVNIKHLDYISEKEVIVTAGPVEAISPTIPDIPTQPLDIPKSINIPPQIIDNGIQPLDSPTASEIPTQLLGTLDFHTQTNKTIKTEILIDSRIQNQLTIKESSPESQLPEKVALATHVDAPKRVTLDRSKVQKVQECNQQ